MQSDFRVGEAFPLRPGETPPVSLQQILVFSNKDSHNLCRQSLREDRFRRVIATDSYQEAVHKACEVLFSAYLIDVDLTDGLELAHRIITAREDHKLIFLVSNDKHQIGKTKKLGFHSRTIFIV